MDDERDPAFQERVREACNKTDAPDTGCMFPWCVCNRYPITDRIAKDEEG